MNMEKLPSNCRAANEELTILLAIVDAIQERASGVKEVRSNPRITSLEFVDGDMSVTFDTLADITTHMNNSI